MTIQEQIVVLQKRKQELIPRIPVLENWLEKNPKAWLYELTKSKLNELEAEIEVVNLVLLAFSRCDEMIQQADYEITK